MVVIGGRRLRGCRRGGLVVKSEAHFIRRINMVVETLAELVHKTELLRRVALTRHSEGNSRREFTLGRFLCGQ